MMVTDPDWPNSLCSLLEKWGKNWAFNRCLDWKISSWLGSFCWLTITIGKPLKSDLLILEGTMWAICPYSEFTYKEIYGQGFKMNTYFAPTQDKSEVNTEKSCRREVYGASSCQWCRSTHASSIRKLFWSCQCPSHTMAILVHEYQYPAVGVLYKIRPISMLLNGWRTLSHKRSLVFTTNKVTLVSVIILSLVGMIVEFGLRLYHQFLIQMIAGYLPFSTTGRLGEEYQSVLAVGIILTALGFSITISSRYAEALKSLELGYNKNK